MIINDDIMYKLKDFIRQDKINWNILPLQGYDVRNSGLVFQDSSFPTTIHN